MKVSETRKEDNLYFKGPFWVVAEDVAHILSNDYVLVCDKELCTYDGQFDRTRPNRKNQTHEVAWEKHKATYGTDLPYNYFPRGRVEVYKGVAYMNLNSLLNTPSIINSIIHEYQIQDLEYHVYAIDELQGAHYDYLLT